MAADATVNYTGTVTQSTCSFEGGNTVNIDLGTRDAAQLTVVDEKYSLPHRVITLAGCPNAVQIEFSGVADTDLVDAFKNDKEATSGGASAVAIRPWLSIDAEYGSASSDITTTMSWVKPNHRTAWLSKNTNGKILIKLSGIIAVTIDK